MTSAALHRHNRILDSMARNPNFTFVSPRFVTAYAETTFPLGFFVSNQTANTSLPLELDDARSFFENGKFPDNFWRRNGTFGSQIGELMVQIYEQFPPVLPGRNEGLGNYVVDPEDPGLGLNGDDFVSHLIPTGVKLLIRRFLRFAMHTTSRPI